LADWRNGDKDFDKGDLKNELKDEGIQDCIADDIADRVNDRKVDGWTQSNARQEALKEIQLNIDRSKQAYENYRQRNMSSMSSKDTMTRPTY
jgi:hypothetical protein